jgi:hypothetical protein
MALDELSLRGERFGAPWATPSEPTCYSGRVWGGCGDTNLSESSLSPTDIRANGVMSRKDRAPSCERLCVELVSSS